MSKNKVADLITDREMVFARLILSGSMTDQHAAEAAGLNPNTAAYIKSKPCVRAYMLEYRALMQQQLVQQQAEDLRRQNLDRERVLARLWEIANLSPEMTRNSITGQVKALTLIITILGLIPDLRTGSAQNKPAPQPTTDPQIHATAWLDSQQEPTTGSVPSPVETGPAAPPDPSLNQDLNQGRNQGGPANPSQPTSVNPLSRSQTQSPTSATVAPVTRVPSSIEESRYGSLRLRL